MRLGIGLGINVTRFADLGWRMPSLGGPVTDANLSAAYYESDIVTITGLPSSPILVDILTMDVGVEYSINGGAWVSSAADFNLAEDDTFQVRILSSDEYATTLSFIATTEGQTFEYVVTTKAFTPIELGAKLLAWWDVDTGITLSGAQVTSWVDRSGSHDAVQAVSASRPVYGATSFNGNPGLTFDGVDDFINHPAVPFPTTAAVEMWGVVIEAATSADTGSRRIFAMGGTGANTRHAIRSVGSGGARRGGTIGGTGSSAPGSTELELDFAPGPHVVRGIITGARVDVQVDFEAIDEGAACVPSIGSAHSRIGAQVATTAVEFWNGQIRDVIVTDALTTDEAELLMDWALIRAGLN